MVSPRSTADSRSGGQAGAAGAAAGAPPKGWGSNGWGANGWGATEDAGCRPERGARPGRLAGGPVRVEAEMTEQVRHLALETLDPGRIS
jgi:hypothetical protein